MHRNALEHLALVRENSVATGELARWVVWETRERLDVCTAPTEGSSDDARLGSRSRLGVVPLADDQNANGHAVTAPVNSRGLAR